MEESPPLSSAKPLDLGCRGPDHQPSWVSSTRKKEEKREAGKRAGDVIDMSQ